MKIKLFGWIIQKESSLAEFTQDDRMACFILMAHTDKVNRLLEDKGFHVLVSQEERVQYEKEGKVPMRIAMQAKEFREKYGSGVHRLLEKECIQSLARNYRLLPALDIEFMEQVMVKVAGWPHVHQKIPYHRLFMYHPSNSRDEGSRAEEKDIYNRQMVWNFKYSSQQVSPRKHVTALYDAVIPIAEHIKASFGENSKRLTLFCIPASTEESQWLRYREFSRMLCEKTGMFDSFKHVHIETEKQPVHLGGEKR